MLLFIYRQESRLLKLKGLPGGSTGNKWQSQSLNLALCSSETEPLTGPTPLSPQGHLPGGKEAVGNMVPTRKGALAWCQLETIDEPQSSLVLSA